MLNVEILPVRKRLFIGLLGFSLVGVGLLLSGIWYLATSDTRTLIDQILPWPLRDYWSALVVACFGTGGIILTLLYAKDITVLHGPMRVALNLFFPIALALGGVFHIDQNRIKSSFIEVNNQLVRSKEFNLLPTQILVLAPHCLQWSECPHKITVDIDNCRRCGRCSVISCWL